MSEPETIVKPTVLRCKVAVLGDTKVGKTALCSMFKRHVNKSYPKNYIMTNGVDFTVKKVAIRDTHTEVKLSRCAFIVWIYVFVCILFSMRGCLCVYVCPKCMQVNFGISVGEVLNQHCSVYVAHYEGHKAGFP
jgi:hypothetical protein